MRLDKFLKVSRLIKRRTVAKSACEGGRVKLNDQTAKAGSTVSPGDTLEIEFGNRTLKVRVNEIRDHVRSSDASSLYEVLEEIYREDPFPV